LTPRTEAAIDANRHDHPTLAEIQTTANSLDLPTAPITGPKLAQQLQAAADKFNAAIAAGEKTTGSGPVDVVYDQLASILIGKSSLITLPLEPSRTRTATWQRR
jgi:hypothetical protein